MKTIFAIALCLCVVQTAFAAPLMALTEPVQKVGGSATECKICLDFCDEALQELIEVIANVGIGGGCSAVCNIVAEKLNSKLIGTVCMLACEVLGIEEFSKLLNEVDPDPIYICERADMCGHTASANATIDQLIVSPSVGHQGGTFEIEMSYTVQSQIATGTVNFEILPPAGMPFGDGEVVIYQNPGTYGVKLSFKATPNEEQPFMPGTYKVVSAVCEGTCGSIHEWTKTLSVKNTTFSLQG